MRGRLLVLLLGAGPMLAPPSCLGAEARARTPPRVTAEVVRGHCSVCHSFQLVEAQRLDRANWEWVMDDMIEKFGATWIGPELRTRIVDYLVEHYGPRR